MIYDTLKNRLFLMDADVRMTDVQVSGCGVVARTRGVYVHVCVWAPPPGERDSFSAHTLWELNLWPHFSTKWAGEARHGEFERHLPFLPPPLPRRRRRRRRLVIDAGRHSTLDLFGRATPGWLSEGWVICCVFSGNGFKREWCPAVYVVPLFAWVKKKKKSWHFIRAA